MMNSAEKEVFNRLKNRFTGDVVITSNLSPRRKGDYGDLIQVFDENNPNRKFWVTENAFDKIGKYCYPWGPRG